MKQTIMLVGALVISTCVFAGSQAGLSKGSQQLNALGSVWKSQQTSQTQLNHNDILMGYAGVDISRRPTLVPQVASL